MVTGSPRTLSMPEEEETLHWSAEFSSSAPQLLQLVLDPESEIVSDGAHPVSSHVGANLYCRG
ncbi:hypothetical protein PAMP_009164 [Pampus punctatissimus]